MTKNLILTLAVAASLLLPGCNRTGPMRKDAKSLLGKNVTLVLTNKADGKPGGEVVLTKTGFMQVDEIPARKMEWADSQDAECIGIDLERGISFRLCTAVRDFSGESMGEDGTSKTTSVKEGDLYFLHFFPAGVKSYDVRLK